MVCSSDTAGIGDYPHPRPPFSEGGEVRVFASDWGAQNPG